MTIIQRKPDHPLEPCKDCGTARAMLDRRGLHCGGGHFVECVCTETRRHASAEAAAADWMRLQGKRPRRKPARPPATDPVVVQLRMPMR